MSILPENQHGFRERRVCSTSCSEDEGLLGSNESYDTSKIIERSANLSVTLF